MLATGKRIEIAPVWSDVDEVEDDFRRNGRPLEICIDGEHIGYLEPEYLPGTTTRVYDSYIDHPDYDTPPNWPRHFRSVAQAATWCRKLTDPQLELGV